MITDDLVNPSIADKSLEVLLEKIKTTHSEQVVLDPDLPSWVDIEPEVWVDVLTASLPEPLSEDKLHRLSIKVALLIKLYKSEDYIEFEDVFYDPILVLKLMETLNNVDAHLLDSDSVPSVSSMEAAWFLDEIKRVMKIDDNSLHLICKEVRQVCAYILHEEGCPTPMYPFSLIIKTEDIHRYWFEGEVPDLTIASETMADREKAVNTYISLMRSKLC